MRSEGVLAELARRAAHHTLQTRLVVDYYRVRRKLAWPLPVRSIHVPEYDVRGHQNYPWATWMLWALEERIATLGWAAELLDDENARALALRDLATLTEWPQYDQYGYPDLALGHSMRILSAAVRSWEWIPETTRTALIEGCIRAVDQHADWLTSRASEPLSNLPEDERERRLANIPVIGTLGCAMAARVSEHPLAEQLAAHALDLITTTLDARENGRTEGVAYDGYVFDFVADWIAGESAETRDSVLRHPLLDEVLAQSIALAVPGETMHVAELSDVEPREMPFHASAHAKLSAISPRQTSLAYLSRARLDWLRSDALTALHNLPDPGTGLPNVPGIQQTRYSITARTGWDDTNLAAVMSASSYEIGHLQRDNGHVVIGTRGQWIVSDPGYQQYLRTSEREFTLGPIAHNAPIINGHGHASKDISLDVAESGTPRARINLTSCYPPEADARRVCRSLWILDDEVVIADEITLQHDGSVTYHWHGHPDAAWWVENGIATVSLNNTDLNIRCSCAPLEEAMVDRLRGSRGQLTLRTQIDVTERAVIWWLFAVNRVPSVLQLSDNAKKLSIGTETLRID